MQQPLQPARQPISGAICYPFPIGTGRNILATDKGDLGLVTFDQLFCHRHADATIATGDQHDRAFGDPGLIGFGQRHMLPALGKTLVSPKGGHSVFRTCQKLFQNRGHQPHSLRPTWRGQIQHRCGDTGKLSWDHTDRTHHRGLFGVFQNLIPHPHHIRCDHNHMQWPAIFLPPGPGEVKQGPEPLLLHPMEEG